MTLPDKRGTNSKTKLPKVRHMSMLKLFYLGLLHFILEPCGFARAWLPHEAPTDVGKGVMWTPHRF